MPERVQLSRRKGWRMPPDTVNVARPGPWGNPFAVGSVGVPDAHTAVAKHREWIEACLLPDHPGTKWTVMALAELRGKHLACWCAPDQPCHADTLLDLANR